MKSLFIWSGVGILAAAGIFAALTFANKENPLSSEILGQDYSKNMPYEGAAHVVEGTEVTYQSNPPTSGSHWPDPLLDGIYDTEKPDEALVHSLEHGRIWISYQPSSVPQSAIDQLTRIAKSEKRVILTPRSLNETPIALAAWQRLDMFGVEADGSIDEQRILDFIKRYRDKGPEYVPQMTGKPYN